MKSSRTASSRNHFNAKPDTAMRTNLSSRTNSPLSGITRSNAAKFALAVAVAQGFGAAGACAQNVRTFGNLSSTWGSATNNNWGVGTGLYPGNSTRANGGGSVTDQALITNNGSVSLNLNFGATGNGIGANLTLGALRYETSTFATNTWTFGSNAGTVGTLQLNGGTVNSVGNVILTNTTSGANAQAWTIAPTNGGTGVMTLSLGSSGNNVVVIGAGSGSTFGSTTAISANITQVNTGSGLLVRGGGDANNRGGTLTLSGNNSFSGGITVGLSDGSQAGRVRLSGSSALPTTGAVTVNQNSQLRIDATSGTFGAAAQTVTINGLGSAGGNVTNISNGALRYDAGNGNNNVTLASAVALGTTAPGIHVENGTGTNTLTLSGNVSGSTLLTKTGAGVLTFSGTNNTNSGGVSIQNGSLTVSSGSSLGTGALSFAQTGTNNATVTLNNTSQAIAGLSSTWSATTGTTDQRLNLNGTALTINQSVDGVFGSGAVSTLTSTIAGTGSIVKSGSATLTLSGNNSYSGGTTISAGTLLVTNTIGSGTGSGNVTVNAGALGGSGIINGNVAVNGATIGSSGSTLSLGSNLTSSGASDVAASSTVNVAGTTTVSSGTLTVNGALGVNGSIAGTGAVVVSSTGSLTGNATINNATTVSGGTFGTSGNTLNLGSTLAASGNNTIATGVTVNVTGNTTISGGVFTVNGTLGGTGAKIVGSGATLKGNSTISGPTTIQADGTLSPGNSPGIQTFSGNLTLAGTTVMEVNGTGRGTAYDGINLTGTGSNTLTYGGTLSMSFNAPITATVYDLFAIGSVVEGGDFGTVTIGGTAILATTGTITGSGWTATVTEILSGPTWNLVFDNASGDLTITAIPEPSAYAALAGVGMIGFALYRRRRQNAAKRAA